MFKKTLLATAIVFSQQVLWAEAETDIQLEAIEIDAQTSELDSSMFKQKSSDRVVSKEVLKTRSATLGNALSGELGVHSNPFGGGASKPIIRGQEGVRVKILQNGTDVVDMSAISPDHAVVADTLLAQKVEVVRGVPTLMYASASPAGVVNVIDQRIPESIPDRGYEGDVLLRFNQNGQERVATTGITLGFGNHLALRAEGLARKSDNYKVKEINLGDIVQIVPDTHHRSQVGTVGLSWIGEQGFIGASYSQRKDKYGIPGHNHAYDNCIAHVIRPEANQMRYYLKAYPHLIRDEDWSGSPHYHCGTNLGHHHDEHTGHTHDKPFGYDHDHQHAGPWIDLVSRRTDIKGEWRPWAWGVDKIRVTHTRSDYYHEENDHETERLDPATNRWIHVQNKPSYFKNKGQNTRLEIYHQPYAGITGVWGVQYQKQQSSAYLPHEREEGQQYPLVPNTNQQWSIFGLEQWRVNDQVSFELGGRWESQKIPIVYDAAKLDRYRPKASCAPIWKILGVPCPTITPKFEEPDLSTYKENAFSYSGSAIFDFKDHYRLALTASHNERLPSPMELYYHGKHLATNSYEYGNNALNKEKSNNFELGLTFDNGTWAYHLSAYYQRFKNYIYNENIYREGNLFMRRHTQASANFYGVEGELSYRIQQHEFTLFGDIVRGQLSNLPKAYAKVYTCDGVDTTQIPEETPANKNACGWSYNSSSFDYEFKPALAQADRPAPRVPPARLGLRWKGQFTSNWVADAEYTHVFSQRKLSKLENVTAGYHLLNLGVQYENTWGGANYHISLRGHNLLNDKVYIHNSFLPYVPQIGRNISLGVHVDF